MLSPLGLAPSFGFGDRLGLATPGHIAAVTGTVFSPIFAQQSVRENERTGRTPQQVLDEARRAVEAARWEGPWGADADHLKTLADLPPFIDAGYTFYTVDPGEYVDTQADGYPSDVLQEKTKGVDLAELAALYSSSLFDEPWGLLQAENLLRARVKYDKAIAHAAAMYHRVHEFVEAFDFEVSVDEADSPTSPLEHYYIASELTRLGVKFTSLAPRFIGRFEKGVDYIGDLKRLEADLASHALVMEHFGTYKLSLHSGSDKFSVYPLIARYWSGRMHVKTAGTSYLEALRTLAGTEPALFEKIWQLGLERYPVDRASYHVSAEPKKVSGRKAGASLLDDFDAREILHVTYGSALKRYGEAIHSALVAHSVEYEGNLEKHFRRHLDPLA